MLLALQQDKATVFAGTFGALAVMTVISVGIGQVFHLADEALAGFGASSWDDYLAVALLLVFGVQARAAAILPRGQDGRRAKGVASLAASLSSVQHPPASASASPPFD